MKNQKTLLAELTEYFFELGYREDKLTNVVRKAGMTIAYFQGNIKAAEYFLNQIK